MSGTSFLTSITIPTPTLETGFLSLKSPPLPQEQEEAVFIPRGLSNTQLEQFKSYVNNKHGYKLQSYDDLFDWSTHATSEFWADVWHFTGVVHSRPFDYVVNEKMDMPSLPSWFPGARLNWAQNCLWQPDDNKLALINVGEHGTTATLTYGQLRQKVAQVSRAFRAMGIQPGDRIASYATNSIDTAMFCLAAVAVGAVWSTGAAEMGPNGIVDRFDQIKPKMLLSINGVLYNGKVHPHMEKLRETVNKLHETNPSMKVVVIPQQPSMPGATPDEVHAQGPTYMHYDELLELGGESDAPIDFYQAPSDHPLWILYSSGTTGKPKALVHRAGGILISTKLLLGIQLNTTQDSTAMVFTTTGWMMWNININFLLQGCTVVCYDGSPLKDPSILWRTVDEHNITFMGISPKYLQTLQEGNYIPRERHSLKSLTTILSTGSALKPELYDYVYESVKPDVILSNASGGTDICNAFVGGHYNLPIYRGQLQARNLGLATEVWNEQGQSVIDQPGDLVCTKPFPCMPLNLWGDESNAKYQSTYFSKFPGVWSQGDYCVLNSTTGGVTMLGRSDGVLNPKGIRFGTAELYDAIERVEEVVDQIAVGQKLATGDDERVVLFVQLQQGLVLNDEIKGKLVKAVRSGLTARHVPEVAVQVSEIPYNLTGKRLEVPIKKLINGGKVEDINLSVMRNPACLRQYVDVPELKL